MKWKVFIVIVTVLCIEIAFVCSAQKGQSSFFFYVNKQPSYAVPYLRNMDLNISFFWNQIHEIVQSTFTHSLNSIIPLRYCIDALYNALDWKIRKKSCLIFSRNHSVIKDEMLVRTNQKNIMIDTIKPLINLK